MFWRLKQNEVGHSGVHLSVLSFMFPHIYVPVPMHGRYVNGYVLPGRSSDCLPCWTYICMQNNKKKQNKYLKFADLEYQDLAKEEELHALFTLITPTDNEHLRKPQSEIIYKKKTKKLQNANLPLTMWRLGFTYWMAISQVSVREEKNEMEMLFWCWWDKP